MKSVLSCYEPALALLIIALIFFAHYRFTPHITGDILTYCNSYRFCIRLQTIQISIGQAYCVCTQLMFCQPLRPFFKSSCFFVTSVSLHCGGDLSAKVKPGQDHTSCSERHVGKAVVCKSGNFLVFFCLGLGDMAQKIITIIIFISVDIDNYHDKCQIFISFKFKARFLLQSERFRNQTINFP